MRRPVARVASLMKCYVRRRATGAYTGGSWTERVSDFIRPPHLIEYVSVRRLLTWKPKFSCNGRPLIRRRRERLCCRAQGSPQAYRLARCSTAQPQEHRSRHPSKSAGGDHGAVRVGQVVAGVRYDIRRRTAALCRELELVCAAVPRADGQARRRPDYGPGAGDCHRAEDDHAKPAFDGGHADGDLRPPAAVICTCGPDDLSRKRRGSDQRFAPLRCAGRF